MRAVALFGFLVFTALWAGCITPSPPDREPDLVFEGKTPTGFDLFMGHKFEVPEGTRSVTACFAFGHEEATFELGPYGTGSTFSVYLNKTEPFCVHKQSDLEEREWRVQIHADGDAPYSVRLWWR